MQKYRGCHRAAIAIYCDFSDGNHNLFLFFIENLHLQHFMEKLQQIMPPMGLSAAICYDSDADSAPPWDYLLRFAEIVTQIVSPMELSAAICCDNDADNASLGTICCNP